MKKIICSVIIFCGILFSGYGQQPYPKEIQTILDELKYNAKDKLARYRWRGNKERFRFQLMYEFSFPDSLVEKAKNYNLSVGMLYDEDMRNRIVELLKGEILPYEMDTIEFFCKTEYSYDGLTRRAFYEAKIDTISFFQTALKKLYEDLEKEDKVDMHKKLNNIYDIELFEQLKLDTISEYQKLYQDLLQSAYSRNVEDLLEDFKSNDHSEIAKLSGYINDKRFINPLIAALNEPERFKREVVLEALARMKVDPYYTQYIEKRTRSLNLIKEEYPDFRVEELADVIRTQESFRELSKYLLSEIPYSFDIGEFESFSHPISDDAYYLIKDNIENEGLQNIVLQYKMNKSKEILQEIYDWMQKNYGKYKIKRIW